MDAVTVDTAVTVRFSSGATLRGTVTGARIAVSFAPGELLEGWSHRDRPS